MINPRNLRVVEIYNERKGKEGEIDSDREGTEVKKVLTERGGCRTVRGEGAEAAADQPRGKNYWSCCVGWSNPVMTGIVIRIS